MKEISKKLNKTIKIFPVYILFAIPSVVVGMLFWSFFIDGRLYYCNDWVPFLDFIPPFVHGPEYGDYWIAAPGLVWFIWFLLIGLILVVPYLLATRVRPPNKS